MSKQYGLSCLNDAEDNWAVWSLVGENTWADAKVEANTSHGRCQGGAWQCSSWGNDVVVSWCWVHFVQAVIKRVHKDGLTDPYKNWDHLSSAAASPSHIMQGFSYISREAQPRQNVVTTICVSVCLSLITFPYYSMDLDVSWGNGRRCLVVVHYWLDLQSVHRFRYHDNIAPNVKCERMLVFTVCLVK